MIFISSFVFLPQRRGILFSDAQQLSSTAAAGWSTLPTENPQRLNSETPKLSSQRDILRLIPTQCIEEVFWLDIRPEVIDYVEIRIYCLHGQQTAQPSTASPPHYKVNSRDFRRTDALHK